MSGELHVQNLGKSYRQWGSELRRVASWFAPFIRPHEEHWVLKAISFSIGPGEAVGIVGQNGAGKSTLLKLITGTTSPTEGRVQLRGRVAAILELGMGFNPDLTGRQNAYHSAGLMGYSQADIEKAMPEIEAFAEVGEYFDQPVRTYSSGMQMRVTFSVATAFRPDLLIIDEALSVGDTYFQHKSFDRIREFQSQGCSLLIVSHDRSSVQALCDRAILLEKGRMIKDGNPEEVMDFYNALIAEKENQKVEILQHGTGKVQTISGTGEVTLMGIKLLNSEKEPIEFVGVGEPVELVVNVQVNADIPQLVFGYMIKDRLGQTLFGTNTWHTRQIVSAAKAGSSIEYHIAFPMNLGPGSYSIATALHSHDVHVTNNYEWRDLACVFHVVNLNKFEFVGSTWLAPNIEVYQ
ncbi:MAG: ABC transporter ATP-binding protein [Methylococcales bacterium]|nr:ABC transporter ATP-binding protein [Methylococcales bacterium]